MNLDQLLTLYKECEKHDDCAKCKFREQWVICPMQARSFKNGDTMWEMLWHMENRIENL